MNAQLSCDKGGNGRYAIDERPLVALVDRPVRSVVSSPTYAFKRREPKYISNRMRIMVRAFVLQGLLDLFLHKAKVSPSVYGC